MQIHHNAILLSTHSRMHANTSESSCPNNIPGSNLWMRFNPEEIQWWYRVSDHTYTRVKSMNEVHQVIAQLYYTCMLSNDTEFNSLLHKKYNRIDTLYLYRKSMKDWTPMHNSVSTIKHCCMQIDNRWTKKYRRQDISRLHMCYAFDCIIARDLEKTLINPNKTNVQYRIYFIAAGHSSRDLYCGRTELWLKVARYVSESL